MPNRVIKDSIWSSPSLSKLSEKAQLHWPRWLLQPDDWGCFNADEDIIKGLVYPKMKSVTTKKILELRDEYNQSGMLFLWSENGRVWGYFISFEKHHPQFCNSTHLDGEGKQARHKRKTPEPPTDEIEKYLFDIKQVLLGKLERVRTFKDKYRNPVPVPNPNHEPNPNPSIYVEQEVIDKIVFHLNKQAGTKFKPNTKQTKALVRARFNDGFSSDDFLSVINKKVSGWRGDAKMEKYLRPETLFSPSKFESYLNEKVSFTPTTALQGSIADKDFRSGT